MRNRVIFQLLLALVTTGSAVAQQDSFSNLQLLPPVTEADIPDDIYRDSWARLPAVQRQDLDADGARAYDLLTGPGGGYENGLRGPLGMWMYSPQLAEGAWQLRQRVRYGANRDQRLTELTILATAREISNQYEWSAHEPLGRAAGLEEAIMDFVRYRRPMDEAAGIAGMGELERVIIQFTREVISEPKVSQETFATAVQLLGPEGVMDLTGLIGYYHFVAMTLKAFDVQRQPGEALMLPMRAD